jgi:hypothetical protein
MKITSLTYEPQDLLAPVEQSNPAEVQISNTLASGSVCPSEQATGCGFRRIGRNFPAEAAKSDRCSRFLYVFPGREPEVSYRREDRHRAGGGTRSGNPKADPQDSRRRNARSGRFHRENGRPVSGQSPLAALLPKKKPAPAFTGAGFLSWPITKRLNA